MQILDVGKRDKLSNMASVFFVFSIFISRIIVTFIMSQGNYLISKSCLLGKYQNYLSKCSLAGI